MNATSKKHRIVFMGSPNFALGSLEKLSEIFDVVGVVTQPDRPAGRGRHLTSPAVKILAQEKNIPVIQPKSLRSAEAFAQLTEWNPDVIVVAAFGQILRPKVLNLPKFGCINVHASLLPRWRGAAPIQAAILHGDSQSGVTIMRMDPGLDTGPILRQRILKLDAEETAGTLSDKLANLGAELLVETLPPYLAGDIEAIKQDDDQSTYAPMLKKTDGELDTTKSAAQLAAQIRAYNPWPGSFLRFETGPLKVHEAHALAKASAQAGVIKTIDGLPAVATQEGWLILDQVQPPGKKAMSGADFLRGARHWNGQIESAIEKEIA